MSARDVQYEKCAVLYNYAALWSRIGAWEFGSGSEDGIKRACAAFQASAGAFGMLGDLSERKLFEEASRLTSVESIASHVEASAGAGAGVLL